MFFDLPKHRSDEEIDGSSKDELSSRVIGDCVVVDDCVESVSNGDDCGLNSDKVTSLNSYLIIFWISSSVFSSILAVASSIKRTLG